MVRNKIDRKIRCSEHCDTRNTKALMTSLARQNPIEARAKLFGKSNNVYDAKVLKITLNREHAVYQVRVLMPNGRVRNLQLSAAR